MKNVLALVAAVWLLIPTAARAAKQHDIVDGNALLAELKTTGVDKRRFEAYVKRRVNKINERHKARMDFLAKESDIWNNFWTKVRDERKLFEIRIGRQMLDLFESLSSLNPEDHAVSMADFERMQANVIKSFETQQRQKLSEFFAAREARWREFVAAQERERADFLAEGPTDWQATARTEPAASPARRGKKARAAAPPPEAAEEGSMEEGAEAPPAPAPPPMPRAAAPAPAPAKAPAAAANKPKFGSHWGN